MGRPRPSSPLPSPHPNSSPAWGGRQLSSVLPPPLSSPFSHSSDNSGRLIPPHSFTTFQFLPVWCALLPFCFASPPLFFSFSPVWACLGSVCGPCFSGLSLVWYGWVRSLNGVPSLTHQPVPCCVAPPSRPFFRLCQNSGLGSPFELGCAGVFSLAAVSLSRIFLAFTAVQPPPFQGVLLDSGFSGLSFYACFTFKCCRWGTNTTRAFGYSWRAF